MMITPEHFLWLFAGIALGAVYLGLIRYSVHALIDGGRFGVLPHLALRLVLAGSAFFIAAKQGALALILLLCGFVIVRTFVLSRIRAGK